MITSEKAINLIKIYTYVCERYEHELKYLCERHSNNNVPIFSDEEVLTVYRLSCQAAYRIILQLAERKNINSKS